MRIVPHIEASSKREPDVCFEDSEGIIQRLWQLTDTAVIENIINGFSDKQLFIADGHHRYETALSFRDYLREKGVAKDGADGPNYIMMMLVDMDNSGLVVWPTHRILTRLGHFDACDSLKQMSESFFIEEKKAEGSIEKSLMRHKDQHVLGFYAGGQKWYQLTLKEDRANPSLLDSRADAVKDLDVSILHDVILEPIFGIDEEKLRTQANLTYTRSEEEAIAFVKAGKAQCAFFLNPTKVSQIKNVSLANEKMPQKSTYFYPKIITGLAMNKLMDIPDQSL